tara:strand:+ start:347 stop:712 length:366 start_codon:yes stop_codon:yes gene_type:complete
MDSYYKIISIIALVVLVICLVLIGIALSKSSKESIFPPHVSKCPDFYTYNPDTSECEDNKEISKSTVDNCSPMVLTDEKYSNPGMGRTSGMCHKKKLAKKCGVNWDGITNNSDVCYKINTS